jgi:Zn-dependent protease
MDLNQIFLGISISTLPLLLALTVPEIARGRVAMALGDKTPSPRGPLSLNPLKYVHPIGTLLLPVLTVVIQSPLVFGWARPVPVDPRNFKNPRSGFAWLAAAGPLANLVMAFIWALLWVRVAPSGWLGSGDLAFWVALMGKFGVTINAFLGVLTLLPIPPFAGGQILVAILPRRAGAALAKLEPYGFWIVLGLLFLEMSNIIAILGPTVWWVRALIVRLVS